MVRREDLGFSLVTRHAKGTLCLARISQWAALSLSISITQCPPGPDKAAICYNGAKSQSLVSIMLHLFSSNIFLPLIFI